MAIEAGMQKLLLNSLRVRNVDFQVKVNGSSMNPLLFDSDIVIIGSYEKLKPGDIILFDANKKGLLVHRIIKIEGECILAKGDNAVAIEKTSAAHVYGKVKSVYIRESCAFIPIKTGIFTWVIPGFSRYINKRWKKYRNLEKSKSGILFGIMMRLSKKQRS